MGLHSKYSPSKLPRIVNCPGSVQSSADKEQEDSKYAQEGTMLHSASEESLTLNEYTLSNTIISQYNLDMEQQDAVQDILDWVFALKAKYADEEDSYDLVESKVSLAEFASIYNCGELEEVAGTLDYAFVLPAKRLLICADWKFGKGIEVFADSEQLKAYALGKLKNLENARKFDRVVVVIAQPRLYSGDTLKSIVYTVDELLDWLGNKLVPALLNAKSRNPKFCPSKETCRWCDAKHDCKARQTHAMNIASDVFAVHADIPDQVDLNQVKHLLIMLPDLKSYMEDIEIFVMNRIKNGLGFPGHKLVEGRSVRTWKNPDEALKWLLANKVPKDKTSISKFITPPQTEKEFGKKLTSKDGFKDLIIKPKGKPTLVETSDKRKALVFETVEEKFTDFVE